MTPPWRQLLLVFPLSTIAKMEEFKEELNVVENNLVHREDPNEFSEGRESKFKKEVQKQL